MKSSPNARIVVPDRNGAPVDDGQMGGNACTACLSYCYTCLCVNCLFNLCCNCH